MLVQCLVDSLISLSVSFSHNKRTINNLIKFVQHTMYSCIDLTETEGNRYKLENVFMKHYAPNW